MRIARGDAGVMLEMDAGAFLEETTGGFKDGVWGWDGDEGMID